MSPAPHPANEISRRAWLAAGGLALAGACTRPKSTGYPGYALVATSGDRSLGVVDLATFRLLRPIWLGSPPTAVIPADGHAYVLTPANGSVQVIDGRLQRISSRRLADELTEIRLAPDGKRLMAITHRGRELIEADPVSLRPLRRHKLAAEPTALDVATTGYVAISTGRHGTVELLDLASGRWSKAQMPGEIGAVRFRSDGELLLVANFHEQAMTVLTVPDLQVMADLPLAMRPENLCFTADQGQLFVSGRGMDGVAIVFPFDHLEIEQTLLAGRDPGVMACSSSPSYLFVASNTGSDVSILNVDTRKLTAIVEVGEVPKYITITPDSQYALVFDEDSGDMAVIHIPAIKGNRLKSGASLFTVMPVGAKPVDAAVIAAA